MIKLVLNVFPVHSAQFVFWFQAVSGDLLVEPRLEKIRIFAYAKTKARISSAVTAQLISAFIFATWIVRFLLYLYSKLQDSSVLLWAGLCQTWSETPDGFSWVAAQFIFTLQSKRLSHCSSNPVEVFFQSRVTSVLEHVYNHC